MKLDKLLSLGKKLFPNYPVQATKILVAALSVEQFIARLPSRSQDTQMQRIKAKYVGKKMPPVAEAQLEVLDLQGKRDAYQELMTHVKSGDSRFTPEQMNFFKRVKVELDRLFFDAMAKFNQHKTLERFVTPRGELVSPKEEAKATPAE